MEQASASADNTVPHLIHFGVNLFKYRLRPESHAKCTRLECHLKLDSIVYYSQRLKCKIGGEGTVVSLQAFYEI